MSFNIKHILALVLLSGCSGQGISNTANKESNVSIPYFGEEPPGLTPKLFDPKIISPEGRFEGGSFSPDMKEFYFTRKNGRYKQRTFFVIRNESGSWGHESETEIRWPKFSADGNKMYLRKKYKERTENGWSELKSPGDFIKDQAHGLSVSAQGTYYFTMYNKDNVNGSIVYSRQKDGKYEKPIKLGAQYDVGKYLAGTHIAPDESYLMWSAEREDGHGGSDIFITFKDNDGSWSPAINMGPLINSKHHDTSPRVTHDGKYLFFSRGQWVNKEDGSRNWVGKSYWVDATIIEGLRPTENSN